MWLSTVAMKTEYVLAPLVSVHILECVLQMVSFLRLMLESLLLSLVPVKGSLWVLFLVPVRLVFLRVNGVINEAAVYQFSSLL